MRRAYDSHVTTLSIEVPMRPKQLGTVACMIAGAFFIYCGNTAVNGFGSATGDGGTVPGDSSFVSEANAGGSSGGSCCSSTAPAFTKIAEFDLDSAASPTSTAISVAGAQEINVYASGSCYYVDVRFRANAATQFSTFATANGDDGVRVPVNGSDVQVRCRPYNTTGSAVNGHFVVATVQ